jgi:hypothetical protein
LSACGKWKQQGGRKQTSRECLFVLPYKLKIKDCTPDNPPGEPLFPIPQTRFLRRLRIALRKHETRRAILRDKDKTSQAATHSLWSVPTISQSTTASRTEPDGDLSLDCQAPVTFHSRFRFGSGMWTVMRLSIA